MICWHHWHEKEVPNHSTEKTGYWRQYRKWFGWFRCKDRQVGADWIRKYVCCKCSVEKWRKKF